MEWGGGGGENKMPYHKHWVANPDTHEKVGSMEAVVGTEPRKIKISSTKQLSEYNSEGKRELKQRGLVLKGAGAKRRGQGYNRRMREM